MAALEEVEFSMLLPVGRTARAPSVPSTPSTHKPSSEPIPASSFSKSWRVRAAKPRKGRFKAREESSAVRRRLWQGKGVARYEVERSGKKVAWYLAWEQQGDRTWPRVTQRLSPSDRDGHADWEDRRT